MEVVEIAQDSAVQTVVPDQRSFLVENQVRLACLPRFVVPC